MNRNILLVCILLPLSAASGNDLCDLLKDTVTIENFVHDTSNSCFSGCIEDSKELFAVIDGEAVLYTKYGFRRGAYIGYFDGVHNLCVEMYDMDNSNNARSLYNADEFITAGGFEVLPNCGDSARIDTSSAYAYSIEILVHSYFIQLEVPSKDTTLQHASIKLAQYLVERIQTMSHQKE